MNFLELRKMEKAKFSRDDRLLRINEVLKILGIGKSSLYAGINNGIYPAPLKMEGRSSFWVESHIIEFVNQLIDRS
jgi:prophage regulatory protein